MVAPLYLFNIGITVVIIGGIVGLIYIVAHHYITKK